MKVLENYQKNVFSGVSFLKNSSCPIHLPIALPKTDSTASVSFVFKRILRFTVRASVLESVFSKLTEI